MPISFDAYRMFYYVGKYKNITKAASELFLSQSTVSRGLQSLEYSLGCRLFERTQHGVAFTAEGEALYSYVSAGCDQIFRGEERIQQMMSRILRIGVSDFASNLFVMPVLDEFYKENPTVKLEIVSRGFNSYAAVFDSLLSGKTDLACVAAASPEKLSHDDIDIVSAAVYRDIIIAGENCAELKTGSYSLEELSRYPFASLVTGSTSTSFLDILFKQYNLLVTPEFETDSIEMFISIVRKGRYLALIPEFFKDIFSGEGQFFEVSVHDELPSHNINILTVRIAPRSILKEAFVARLRQYIRSRADLFSETNPDGGERKNTPDPEYII